MYTIIIHNTRRTCDEVGGQRLYVFVFFSLRFRVKVITGFGHDVVYCYQGRWDDEEYTILICFKVRRCELIPNSHCPKDSGKRPILLYIALATTQRCWLSFGHSLVRFYHLHRTVFFFSFVYIRPSTITKVNII